MASSGFHLTVASASVSAAAAAQSRVSLIHLLNVNSAPLAPFPAPSEVKVN